MFSNKKEVKQTQERHQESSLFGKGSTFTGTIDSSENIRVDGKIIGTINAKAKVVAGPESLIEGNIHAERAEISGEIKGDIEVTDILILRASAKIHGDITTDKLIMDEGASFNGKCNVGEKVKALKLGNGPETHNNGKKLNGNHNGTKTDYISVAG
ncbi:polymer-forming cytoskeletal protein [Fulvivirgaceae bacterium BMA12]|uniref:Polymer-forming cytoskeletal protein n=1 Tax=Agaribacillus aureus TaxID=3051825 RepID=A0ABT8L573_9BACT|nr:polymer-forming cytoskeletal protein [Fulvivirgaceae bacterium BMA12]